MVSQMTKTTRHATLLAAALAAATLPGSAYAAGSSTGSGTAALTVGAQCSVEGANIDLGTFTTSQTWQDVFNSLGYFNADTYVQGSRGLEYLNFGSVTCSNGAPFTLTMHGSGTDQTVKNGISLQVGNQQLSLAQAIKRIGTDILPDDSDFWPVGVQMFYRGSLSYYGTGAPQQLLGNVTTGANFGTPTIDPAARLGTAGSFQDTLSYTLTF
jgi:hypothetical protein